MFTPFEIKIIHNIEYDKTDTVGPHYLFGKYCNYKYPNETYMSTVKVNGKAMKINMETDNEYFIVIGGPRVKAANAIAAAYKYVELAKKKFVNIVIACRAEEGCAKLFHPTFQEQKILNELERAGIRFIRFSSLVPLPSDMVKPCKPFLRVRSGIDINKYKCIGELASVETYIEPFLTNGNTMLSYINRNENINKYVINSFDGTLISTWFHIKEYTDEFIDELRRYEEMNSEDDFIKLKNRYMEIVVNTIEKCALYVYLNHMCRKSDLNSWYIKSDKRYIEYG